MTLTQLRYLVAVEVHRSFGEAARACSVSQPALSMQVQKLEETVGVRVFDRSRQPVLPTPEGLRVLAQARTVIREADRMAQVVAETTAELSGPYRLAVIPTLAPVLLPRLIPGFIADHPRVQLEVEEVQTDRMIARLLADELDGGLAATPLGVPGLRERPLFREPFHLYAAPGHRLLGRRRVKQSDLAGEEVWIMAEGHCFREQVLHLCKIDRPVASVRFHAGSFDSVVRLVDAGLGVTVLPELVVRALPPERMEQVRRLSAPVPTREVSFVHAREHLRSRVADALVGALEDNLPADLRRVRGEVLSPLPSSA